MKLKKEFTSNMGAIQNSLNQITGAITGGVLAMEHLSEQQKTAAALKSANEEKALILESKDLPEQEAQIKDIEKAITTHLEENPELTAPGLEGRLGAEEASGDADLPNSLTKAKEALDSMEKERLAKITLRDLTRKRIETLRGGKR